MQMKFLEVCIRCKAVVCCRMSPKQKAQMVQMVKSHTTEITLAIGDGANDVAMIEQAHVGVGIEGLEGKQATMASDYSIGQFRFLQQLLLIHGAWSYRRISMLILYSFYKNLMIALTQIWFAFFSGFSAQTFYDALCGSMFNMIFTCLPVLAAAVFNRDLSKETMLRIPQLYMSGQRHESFNLKLLFLTILRGVFDSLVLFFFSIYVFHICTRSDGLENDQWVISTAMFTYAVLVANAKIALETKTWVWYSHLFFWITIASWFLCISVYTAFDFVPNMYGVFRQLSVMPAYWLMMILVPLTCIIPDLTYHFVRISVLRPTFEMIGTHYTNDLEFWLKAQKNAQLQKMKARQTSQKLVLEGKIDVEVSLTEPELRRDSTWTRVAHTLRKEHGYVNFQESEKEETFVMPQQRYLRIILASKKTQMVHLDESSSSSSATISSSSSSTLSSSSSSSSSAVLSFSSSPSISSSST
eukprot:TRINITY_DN4571_c0_g1_i1.p1 TRINITY_DN4571_c0_g1~~TRINITY_DN4571_c0_g1_i1.p1  ORF type:complete len:496 (-),score=119.14 TRINITY_DN4571_c0_g1_i1:252-1661(-)